MKKLTLEQAAAELGIKKESVYKRAQRHTLPYTVESDGRMYVYLDGEKIIEGAGGEGADARGSESNSGGTERSWWDYAAGASGVFVLVGALVYALGLFTLWVPIWKAYTNDFVTAWHAVALVPRTVVAGLGIQQLVGFPLLITVLLLSALLVVDFVVDMLFRLFPRRRKVRVFRKVEGTFREAEDAQATRASRTARIARTFFVQGMGTCVVWAAVALYAGWRMTTVLATISPNLSPWRMALVVFLGLIAVWAVATAPLMTIVAFLAMVARGSNRRENLYVLFFFLLGGVVPWLVGFYLTLRWAMGKEPLLEQLGAADTTVLLDALIVLAAAFVALLGASMANGILTLGGSELVFKKKLLYALVAVGASAFIAACLLATINKPPLPRATLTVVVPQAEEPTIELQRINGHLLTRTEGAWYVFDRSGHLVAVPDAKVQSTRVLAEK